MKLLEIPKVKSLVGSRCLIRIDRDKNLFKKMGGVELKLDNIYNRLDDDFIPSDEYLPQDGVIVGLPLNVSGSLQEVKLGDRVLVHHFVPTRANMVKYDGHECYFFDFYRDFVSYITTNVYCVLNDDKGVKKMVDGWNFVKLRRYKEGFGEFEKEVIDEKWGELEYVNEGLGLSVGDKVSLNTVGLIRVFVDGEEKFLVHNSDVLLKVE